MRMLGIAAAALVVAVPAAFAQTTAAPQKLSQAECQAIWKEADASGAGSLSMSQAQPYVTNFKQVDTNGDNSLSGAEFLNGCSKGLAHSASSSGTSTGTSGSSNAPAKKY